MDDDPGFWRLLKAIASADSPAVIALLNASPALASMSVVKGATRASAAEAYLTEIDHPALENRGGSTPLLLAGRPTGRGGSGTPEAKAQQTQIVGLLAERHRRSAPS